MNLASIDIGSNTVLLLITEYDSENHLHTILNEYRSPRISLGLTYNQNISDVKIIELLDVLTEYNQIIKKNNCRKILLVGTNALRVAKNSGSILDLVKSKLGYKIDIIDGKNEAHLSFLGTVYPYLPSTRSKIVIDIGGGSTEIIYGNNFDIQYMKSFEIGVVSLTEKFLVDTPPSSNKINKAILYTRAVFNEIVPKIDANSLCFAVAGTPTTLSCIKQNLKDYKEGLVDESSLTNNDIDNILEQLIKMRPQQILEKYGPVVKGREDVILAGTIILKIIMELLNCNKINVSTRGLRYGVIVDYIINELKRPVK
ncbi:MAG: hypothetical protein AB1521_06435 [Bacteroidota bacterium]